MRIFVFLVQVFFCPSLFRPFCPNFPAHFCPFVSDSVFWAQLFDFIFNILSLPSHISFLSLISFVTFIIINFELNRLKEKKGQ